MTTLSCYYVDEPLTPDEHQFAIDTLTGPGADFQTGATSLVEKRVLWLSTSARELTDADVERARKRLRDAGIQADVGRQVLFIIPRELSAARIFQAAIHAETGFYPFTLQRWNYALAEPEPDEPRIIDIHGLTCGGGGNTSCSRT